MNSLFEAKNDDDQILVDLNARNSSGNTALHIASHKGNLEVVRSLIPYLKKEDIDECDPEGNTALIKAAEKGYFDVVEELINYRANVNASGNNKRTALMAAVESGHIRVVKLLIKKGAKMALKDKYDKTVLDIISAKLEELNNNKNKKGKVSSDYSRFESIKGILESRSRSKLSSRPVTTNRIELFNEADILSKLEKQRSSDFSDDDEMVTSDHWEVSVEECDKDLKGWEKDDPLTFKKILQLIEMIKIDPFRGLGQVERLSGDLEGLYSRRINKQDRLVYMVDGEKVFLKSCKGHYQQEKRKKSNRTKTKSKRK